MNSAGHQSFGSTVILFYSGKYSQIEIFVIFEKVLRIHNREFIFSHASRIYFSLNNSRTAIGAERVHFSMEVTVKGYHACNDVWAAAIGEQFPCQSEHGNV